MGNDDNADQLIAVLEKLWEQRPFNVDRVKWLAAGITSASYAIDHMPHARRFPGRAQIIQFAISKVTLEGLFLEFGVFSGGTINRIAKQVPSRRVYGFDSFKGLPEPWLEAKKGNFALEELPKVEDNVELIVGWFDRSLPQFCERFEEEIVAFLHIDCDLYSSTATVLNCLRDKIRSGTVILFDEYFNYPEWERHEFRAWQEFIRSKRISYEYLAIVPSSNQVAIRVI